MSVNLAGLARPDNLGSAEIYRTQAICKRPQFVDTTSMRGKHISHERLERFILGNMASPESQEIVDIEQHLLVCSRCIAEARRAEQFVQLIRLAFSELEEVNALSVGVEGSSRILALQ